MCNLGNLWADSVACALESGYVEAPRWGDLGCAPGPPSPTHSRLCHALFGSRLALYVPAPPYLAPIAFHHPFHAPAALPVKACFHRFRHNLFADVRRMAEQRKRQRSHHSSQLHCVATGTREQCGGR